MKKVLFVLALCVTVIIANAQEKKASPVKTVKTEEVAPMPGKTLIKEADLMQPIKDNIAKDFAGATILKSFKNEVKGLFTYEVIIKKDYSRWSLIYDKDGKFMKKEEMAKPEIKKVEGTKEIKKAAEQPKK